MISQKKYAVVLISITALVLVFGLLFIVQHRAKRMQPATSTQDYDQLIVHRAVELEQRRLYFYFSQNTCPPCILQTVDLIQKHIPGEEVVAFAAGVQGSEFVK